MIDLDNIELWHGDCLELMKDIPDSSIDLTVTSPPYDNLRSYNGNINQWSFEKFQEIAKELYRVTATGGVVVWVVGDSVINGSETGTSFKQALWFKECGFKLHDTMIYAKESQPREHNRYEQKFEYMFVFVKGKPKTFNPIKIPCKYAGQKTSRSCRDDGKDNLKSSSNIIASEKKKGNIWEYKTGNNCFTSDKIAYKHPAIFPEQLANDHIISWSNEGDTIFDPFMGSGTTGKMAVLNNRKFIGIELDDTYFEIAKERINKANYIQDGDTN